MRTFVCSVCGYVYDEAKGIPEAGIAAGTSWENLPDAWVCPWCGAQKSAFKEKGQAPAEPKRQAAPAQDSVGEPSEDSRELTAMEVSILCSNLARGCEKQYMAEEAGLFAELAEYFRGVAPSAEAPTEERLLQLAEQNLEHEFPAARAAAEAEGDRGALRALVWSEKVTMILKSLLSRCEREGSGWIDRTGVYVCTICGFIFVGDQLPEICPVCKVPNWKFEKVEGRTV